MSKFIIHPTFSAWLAFLSFFLYPSVVYQSFSPSSFRDVPFICNTTLFTLNGAPLSPYDWQDLAGGGTHSYPPFSNLHRGVTQAYISKHRCKDTGHFFPPCARPYSADVHRHWGYTTAMHAHVNLLVNTHCFIHVPVIAWSINCNTMVTI